jgi:hypothetical protein
MDFHDKRDGSVKNVNDPTQFESPKSQVEETTSRMGLQGIRDPHTNVVHMDLSDPNHSFWKTGLEL